MDMLNRLTGSWRGIVGGGCAGVLVVSGIVAATAGSGGAGGSRPGMTIRAAEFTWTAAAITNAILEGIAASHPGLGVSQIVSTPLDPTAAWAGAARGNIDLLTEVALPNQQPLAEQAKNRVKLIDQTYGNAVQGWFVPSYVVQPGGPAAGLSSITQLNQYANVFGDKLIDADPGWVTTKQNTLRLKAYGIKYEDVSAGANDEIAQLERSYRLHQPILIYLYEPHWVFARYKLVQLQEPNPYKPGCFTGSGDKCAIPTLSAWIAASNTIAAGAPKFYAMLKRVKIPLVQMEQMLQQVDVNKVPAGTAAQQWLNAHRAQVNAWNKG